jgi:membrane-associated phospholipid phosphatase
MDVALRFSRPWTSRLLAALSVILLVVSTALLLDARVPGWAAHWKCSLIDNLVAILNPIGGGLTLLIFCTALGTVGRALQRTRLETASWLGALAFIGAGLVEFAIKHLVSRPRPDAALDIDSFPSGHATSVFAVATVFVAFYPRLRWPLYALAAAVAMGRVYLERHYVSDIIAGAVIGIVIASTLLRYRRVSLPDGPDLVAES